jgi:hypothetical protein
MITHQIRVASQASTKEKEDRYVGVFGTDEHKKFIHARALLKCKYEAGMPVKFRGASGVVLDVLDESAFDSVEWRGLECKFVHVFFYGTNTEVLFHPSELKKE